MNSDAYQHLLNDIIEIKNGKNSVREKLVADYKPFIMKTAAGLCMRTLEWGRDDELSIGMIAFNSAIDTFDVEKQIPFLIYCKVVILNRLRDYFRKEARYLNSYPLDETLASSIESQAAWDQYNDKTIEDERREELEQFEQILSGYSISFEDLVEVSPKHRDYRLSLFKVADILAKAQDLMEHLTNKKQLPLNDLAKISGVSRKTLERGRKFIIASAFILNRSDEFIYLRSYINPGLSDG